MQLLEKEEKLYFDETIDIYKMVENAEYRFQQLKRELQSDRLLNKSFGPSIFEIFSRLSRINTARGSCTGPVTVGPIKV